MVGESYAKWARNSRKFTADKADETAD